MRFYLGTHMVSPDWWASGVPLFVSRRRLAQRRTLPRASAPWALDSGGFTELSTYGGWQTTPEQYVAEVERFRAEIGRLEWVAPQDLMCEPFMLERTGMTVAEHQRLTVENFVRLRASLGRLVVPVLQGWTPDDYLRCWDLYHRAGVDLEWEPTVGLGTVCRRQNTAEAGLIVRALADLCLSTFLHGFGMKTTGLRSYGDALASSDSMAWSYNGRKNPGRCPEGRASCGNCLHHALSWRRGLLDSLQQLRLEVTA